MTNNKMDAEFDDVAGWTAAAVDRLGAEYAIPAACRGSASPSALAWLAESCGLSPGTTLLDLGAGVGGPAAWAHLRYGVRPILVDPMPGACRSAAHLFGLPVVAADGLSVPLRTASIDAAWCLGVLCTVTDKRALLDELHRMVRPGGHLGLLVLVAETTDLDPVPEGNAFPVQAELTAVLDHAGFELVEQIDDPGNTPATWTRRTDEVDRLIREEHADDKAYQESEEQGRRMNHLLSTGQVSTQLVHALRR
ncbi:class I SAM-dependent methyltransferase [Kribbella sp. DT2]|uniref:class I SAM-dependent methyltransferase n=1 Tax=Kribbella sp. DT2 TaxID=3393427 RepID=UPI003CF5E4E8